MRGALSAQTCQVATGDAGGAGRSVRADGGSMARPSVSARRSDKIGATLKRKNAEKLEFADYGRKNGAFLPAYRNSSVTRQKIKVGSRWKYDAPRGSCRFCARHSRIPACGGSSHSTSRFPSNMPGGPGYGPGPIRDAGVAGRRVRADGGNLARAAGSARRPDENGATLRMKILEKLEFGNCVRENGSFLSAYRNSSSAPRRIWLGSRWN